MNVLILDDEVMSVEIMLKQVDWKKCGIEQVYTAYSADGARELLTQYGIDLILCDIEMPGESGIEFMQWARNANYDMECIFLTCHAKFEYAQEAVRLGSRDYILKPAPYEVIEEKVKNIVNLRRENQRNAKAAVIGHSLVQEKKAAIWSSFGEIQTAEALVDKVIRYIYEHVGDFDLSVSTIGNYMNLNSEYISKTFKAEKGITLNKYIVQVRMEIAEQLLAKNVSCTAVAEQTGYENYSYFSTSFKKYYGISPAAYVKEQ